MQINSGMFDLIDDMMQKLAKDKWINEIICREDYSCKVIKDKFKKLNISININSPTIAVIELKDYTLSSYYKYQLMDRFRSLLDELLQEAVVFSSEDRLCILFCWSKHSLISKVINIANQQLKTEINIGVGVPGSKFTDIRKSYFDALKALEHKFYSDKEKIFYFQQVGQLINEISYPYAFEKTIYNAIKNGDSEEFIKEEIEAFFNEIFSKGNAEKTILYENIFRLLIGIEAKLVEKDRTISKYNKCELSHLVAFQSFKELKSCVVQYILNIKKLFSVEHSEGSSIIKQVLHYMEQDCGNVSLNSIANKVYITSAYLSLLFKAETGQTFLEKLTELRIDKAQQLLKATNLKNYEIAEKVGYQDPRYFSEIFKKRVGLLPSQYRDIIS